MASKKPEVASKRARPKVASAHARAARAARAPAQPFPIVGLGASAGGLEVFEQFFRGMPVDSGMGFVLLQHLDPSHPSMLADIVQRATRMPVVEAVDQMPVLPNRLHVIPPNREMTVHHGKLHLAAPAQPHGLRMPIDAFFRSLAEDRGEFAVGVVLSGTGTDGTLGLRSIFGAGGLCLVQDPASAKYDGMPNSAIKAGYANQVLAVDAMPQALLRGCARPAARRTSTAAKSTKSAKPAPAVGDLDGNLDGDLDAILAQLRSSTGHDFSLYKKTTIGRRVERRMAQHNLESLEDYARYTKEHPAELQVLFRELLINVTSFFRDPDAFTALESKILPALLEGKPEGHPLRIWVAGCATGEEVYSVAIVVREWMNETQRDCKVQLYGTDLDEDAIKVARAGWYMSSIAQDMAPQRLRRFFNKDGEGYRVKKEIREMVVFAVQSIIKDPPFTRLDLLCCRNVLIYLEAELQDRVLTTFHYALNTGGVLFLSPSESIGNHTELFQSIDRKWKFYRSKASAASMRTLLDKRFSWVTHGAGPSAAHDTEPQSERHVADLARHALLRSFAPAAVMTDLQGNILYVHGDTGPYLRPAPGRPTHNVVDMAREGLQIELREALRLAADQGRPTSNRPALSLSDGERRAVNLSVQLLPDPDAAHTLLLVSFQTPAEPVLVRPAGRRRAKVSADAIRCEELEVELAHARANMRAILEEQQASNEELKSTNEELQSTNEELQSTNEELETSKEELQSVNEELVTVNSELQIKIEQSASMQDDMKNLLDNIRLGTIFLDRHLLIRRFTRDATQVFRLVATDVGRPLADIRSELLDCDLLQDAQVVLDSLEPTEREARSAKGAWYLARIQPYRTVDNVVDGVVMTFADVTERVNAIAAQDSRLLAEAIVDAVASPLLVLDGTFEVISANHAFYGLFGGDPASTVGAGLFEIGNRRWDVPAVHELLEAPWETSPGAVLRQAEVNVAGTDAGTAADGGATRFKLDARRIGHRASASGKVVLLLSIAPAGATPEPASAQPGR